MKRIGLLAFSGCTLLSLSGVQAAALTPEQIERAIFLNMTLSQDTQESRLGVRILAQRFPNDDSMCDYVAEKLLKGSNFAHGVAVDTLSWYVRTLSDSCTARYRDTLTLARQRYTNEKIVKYLDLALAVPVTASVPQYAEGGVDPLAREAELQQQLKGIASSPSVARGVPVGMSFGQVVEQAGVPQDMESLQLIVARYGRVSALVAHYAGAGMLMFRKSAGNQWELVDRFGELFPVAETYQGPEFGIAQSLACLRGQMFRVYVKTKGRAIRRDAGLLWALTHRLIKSPFPSDRFEEDGMLVGLKLIAGSRHPEALAMLKEIGAAPGDDVPEDARSYALKLERRGAEAGPAPAPEPEAEAGDDEEAEPEVK